MRPVRVDLVVFDRGSAPPRRVIRASGDSDVPCGGGSCDTTSGIRLESVVAVGATIALGDGMKTTGGEGYPVFSSSSSSGGLNSGDWGTPVDLRK